MKVDVLGGGFGGLAGAHELKRLLPDADIHLVSRSDEFFMGFAKLWDLGGTRPLSQGTRSLRVLDSLGIRFDQREVTVADFGGANDRADIGAADATLVALGAVTNPNHAKVIADAGAHDLYDAAALPAMRDALATIERGRVVVSILGPPFKCPPAPFEAVLIVDEVLRQRGVRDRVAVAITTPQPITLPVAGPDASAYIAQHLGERDIELHTKVEPGTLGAGDVVLAVPASAPPPVVRDSGLASESGWLAPDKFTLRTSRDNVYAVGDCTAIPTATAQLPKAGVFAAAEAIIAARNIAADLGVGDGDRFDGHGYCFLELPGERVAFVEGDFYAEPAPDVTLTDADNEQYQRKLAYERERLDAWLPTT